MRKSARPIAATIIAVALALGLASPAAAVPPAMTTFGYTVDSSSPMTKDFPSYQQSCRSSIGWTNLSRHYADLTGSVSETGDYTFTDLVPEGFDGYIAVLSSPYKPSDVSNCIVAIDSTATVRLVEGRTYTILGAGRNMTTGTFSWSVTGPGEFSTSPKAGSSISLSASAAQLTEGETVTLSASVTGATDSLDLTGIVEFFSGDTSLGTSSIGADGAPTSFVASLGAGTHEIVAVYSGTATVFRAQSATVSISVAAAPTPAPTPTPDPEAPEIPDADRADELPATGAGTAVALSAGLGVAAALVGSALLLLRRRTRGA